jgi:hypothetical protein
VEARFEPDAADHELYMRQAWRYGRLLDALDPEALG